ILADRVPDRMVDQVAGDLVLDLALVHLLDEGPRDLARAEPRQPHTAAQGVVGLFELGDDVRPGELELDAALDGGQVLYRYLHGEGRLSTLVTARVQASRAVPGPAPPARQQAVSTSRLRAGRCFVSISPLMGLAGFTLADRLGAKSSPCSVSGCTRTWLSMTSAKGAKLGGRGAPDPKDPASSMCDPCREAFAKTKDVERPCDRPGCTGTSTSPLMRERD